MLRLIIASATLLISVNSSFSEPDNGKVAEFFAGVTLLQQQTDLNPGEKGRKFRELEAMTGISAAEAKTMLVRYREKPLEWQKMYSGMMKLLNETNLVFQKKDSLRTPAGDTGKKSTSAGAPKLLGAKKTNDKGE